MTEERADIKRFQYEAFAKDLSGQVDSVIPPDISEENKNFIVSTIYNYCRMAGEALVNEPDSKLSAQEASFVVQLIGEWIFHKSIDIMRSGIDEAYRDGILKKVAFTIFEIAKQALIGGIPQDNLITLVEEHVKKSFKNALEDLKAKGELSEELTENALNQSNIDAMARNQVEDEVNTEIACMSDVKKAKLASLAVLMRNFESDKLRAFLQNFNKPERDMLIGYLKDPELEENIDENTAMKHFEEMKNALPEAVTISFERAYKKMYKIVKNLSYDEISDIIKDERPFVREYVLACYNRKQKKLPAHIADVISRYLEEKAS